MRVFAFVLCVLGAFPLYAKTNVNVYQTQVSVSDEESSTAQQARKQGMEQVLVKASGDTTIASNPVIAKALNDSARYLSQFGYQSQGQSQVMTMTFNGEQVRQLLSQAEVPIWPAKRENILVWWVDNTEYERTILWETSDSQELQGFQQVADSMGLPISIPVGDFDDVTGVSAADLWGGFSQSIAKASARYPVDAVLIVKADGAQLRWQLYDTGPDALAKTEVSLSGQVTGSDGAKDIATRLSRYYAQKNALTLATESNLSIEIGVSGINNAIDFFHLERGLISLNSVAKARVSTLRGNQVTFRLDLLTSQTGFLSEATTKLSLTESLASSAAPVVTPNETSAAKAQKPVTIELSDGVQSPAQSGESLGEEVQPLSSDTSSQDAVAKSGQAQEKAQSARLKKPDYQFIWQRNGNLE